MELIARMLIDPATYRRLFYLLSAMVLGPVWFSALVTAWSLCFGLVVTPLVIPMLIVLAFMTRAFAAIEAELARSLLDVDAQAPAGIRTRPGFWGWLRGQFSGGFWRAQAYLMIRWVAGFPVAIALVVALSVAGGMLFAPLWVPFVHGGAHLGFWRPHTFLQSLLFVPVGALLMPVAVVLARPLAAPFRRIAAGLLDGDVGPTGPAVGWDSRAGSLAPTRSRAALEIHAAVDGVLVFALVLIWLVASRGYFWPI
jgi:Putative sensor